MATAAWAAAVATSPPLSSPLPPPPPPPPAYNRTAQPCGSPKATRRSTNKRHCMPQPARRLQPEQRAPDEPPMATKQEPRPHTKAPRHKDHKGNSKFYYLSSFLLPRGLRVLRGYFLLSPPEKRPMAFLYTPNKKRTS
jgi:hypothetical protein